MPKKKLSKAEKERLKKEELDKKAKEEEEARVKAEKEESENKEKEKQEAEERRRLENEERKKRRGQLLELDSIWQSNRDTLHNEQGERRKQAKWNRYMLCDGSPDPSVAGEINTYMNLWEEEMEHIDIDAVLTDKVLTLKLISELEFLLEDTPPEELTDAETTRYKDTVRQLQTLIREKLNLASHDLLLKATELMDAETANLQKVIGDETVTLCVWGNLSKNPRIKNHEFEEKGFTFEIPKLLTLSDCALRILFTKFDHFSPYSRSYHPRVKKPIEEAIPEEEIPEEGEKKEGEEGGEEAEKKEGEGEENPEMEREETKDVMAALLDLEADEDEEEDKEKEEEAPVEEESLEEDVEIRTPEPPEFEDFDGDEEAVDLRAYQVLGGIFHFDLLYLPPQPKTVNNWTITKLVEPPSLLRMEYKGDSGASSAPLSASVNAGQPPAAGAATAAAAATAKEGEVKEPKVEKEKPPIGMTITLPQEVYFFEEPQVVRWDSDLNEWRLEGFSEHKFEEENRLLHCKTCQFGTMALVQDAHINMPFQSWELRPHKVNSAILTIIAAIIEVEIEVKDHECCLIQPSDRPELQPLLKQWMPPRELIKKLKCAGVNIFPAEDSHKYVSIQSKNGITEERLYQQMALTSSSMAYSWSKWNSEVNDHEKIVIQAAEHLVDEPLLEEDWSLFLITKKRTTKLKMSEFDEAFSDDHAEGTEFNADLYHMTMEIVTEPAKDRLRATNHTFIDSIYTLLKSTRLVTFA